MLAAARLPLSLQAAKHLPPRTNSQLGIGPTKRWRQITAESSRCVFLLHVVLHVTLLHQFTDTTPNVGLCLANAWRVSEHFMPDTTNKGRLKQRERQRHLTLQFQLQKSALFNLRICACHQKPANVIYYHDLPEHLRLLPSAYFLRRTATIKDAKELSATPVTKTRTPKQLYPTMRARKGQLVL